MDDKRTNTLLTLLGICLLWSLAGCGSSAKKEAQSASDSCAVVSRAAAGDALGKPVRAPVRGHASVEHGVACVFYGPDVPAAANPDVPVAGSVRVVVLRGAGAKASFDDYRRKVSAQPVAGLGDEAYYDGYASLSVLKKDAYLRVAVIGVRDVLGAETKLAIAALPRL